MNNTNSKLSALAVFSELYDNKKDIYDILWEFSKNVIKEEKMYRFTSAQLKEALTVRFGFDNIPEAVYKTLLRKQSDKKLKVETEKQGNHMFYVNSELRTELDKIDYFDQMREQSNNFSKIADKLYGFLQDFELYKDITKENAIEILKKYLMTEHISDDLYNKLSQFVIKLNDENQRYINVLNQIKEGFVIYDGISWSDNLNELGNWRHSVTLYYNMDILFYMAGYSGTVYKNVYDELHLLIQEINKKAPARKRDKYIKTMYFPEVRKQIEQYFEFAEQIVEGVRELDGRETAMNYIVSKCGTRSEVQRMKAELFHMMNLNAIIEDEESSFYNLKQYVNNIESDELIQKYGKDFGKEKAERSLRRINYINMLRDGRQCDKLENCKFLLITRNRLYAKIDSDKDSKLIKQYPRVMTPENLTSKFWFQLNKGFGNKNFPQSLKVLAQAQIIIAHQVGKNLGECYDKLLDERKNGNITEEEAIRQIAVLRQISTLPEDVSLEVMAESYELKEASVIEMIEKQKKEALEKKKQEEYIKSLEVQNKELLEKGRESQQWAEQEIAATQELEKENYKLKEIKQLKDKEIEELKEIISRNEEENLLRKNKWKKVKTMGLWIGFVVCIIITILFFVLEYKLMCKIFTVITAIELLITLFLTIKKYI